MRRARRLLPALFVMLFLLLTYTWMFKPETLGKLRGDVIAGLLYVSNWYQIWVGQGYTASGDFAPLRHLWSLAVEEQFYLIWPVVMLLLVKRQGTRDLARTARWLLLAAVLVAIATAVLYYPGRIGECSVTPDAYWDNRGTLHLEDRHAVSLHDHPLERACCWVLRSPMIWRPVAIMRGPLRSANRLLDLSALIGLLLLFVFSWKIHLITPQRCRPLVVPRWVVLHGNSHVDDDRSRHPSAERWRAGCSVSRR